MTKPDQNLMQIAQYYARRDHRPVDQDHRNAKIAGRCQFGLRAAATGIFGNDHVYFMLAKQRLITRFGERPLGDYRVIPWQGHRAVGRIDQSQQVVVLRRSGEKVQMLLADGQEHPRGPAGQSINRRVQIRNALPAIAGLCLPRRAFKGAQRNTGLRAGRNGICAHTGGKRVRGVNNMGDGVAAQILRQPVNTAKAANPGRQGLNRWRIGASGVGKYRVRAAIGQRTGQITGLGGAAQNQGACHVC